jgi:cob(I)alamin adenosyltransferase
VYERKNLMSSIATKHGDTGTTGLIGGQRTSKADPRVDSYGDVDELNSALGFARSLCSDSEIKGWTEKIQKDLFRVGASLATPPAERKKDPVMTQADVDFLTELVHRIEGQPGILHDWSLPGANTQSAAYEIARTVCRRAERTAVRLEAMAPQDEVWVLPEVLAYLNRLSDLIWLFGRLIEVRANVDSKLRDEAHAGPGFSRAW